MSEEERGPDPQVQLPKLNQSEHVVQDYASLRLSLKAHPLSFLRDELTAEGYSKTKALQQASDGQRLSVTGLVLVRQRPGSAKGVIFITLEDEAGIANLVVWPDVFQRFRTTVLKASLLGVSGRVQRAGKVIHLVSETLVDQTDHLATLEIRPRNLIDAPIPPNGKTESENNGKTGSIAVSTKTVFQRAITGVDEVKRPIPDQRKSRRLKLIQSRDFH